MSDRWRPDQIIYGRYNDPAMAVVVLVGLATLVGAGRRRLLIDGAPCSPRSRVRASSLWIAEGDVLGDVAPLRPMVLGVLPFSGRGAVHVAGGDARRRAASPSSWLAVGWPHVASAASCSRWWWPRCW